MELHMHDAHQPRTAKPIQHHHSQAQPTWTFLGWLPHGRERAPMEKDLFYCMFARSIGKLLLKRPPPGRCAAQSTIPRGRLPACLWPSPWLPRYLLRLCLTRRDTRLLPPCIHIPPGKPPQPHGLALTPALVSYFYRKGVINCSLICAQQKITISSTSLQEFGDGGESKGMLLERCPASIQQAMLPALCFPEARRVWGWGRQGTGHCDQAPVQGGCSLPRTLCKFSLHPCSKYHRELSHSMSLAQSS